MHDVILPGDFLERVKKLNANTTVQPVKNSKNAVKLATDLAVPSETKWTKNSNASKLAFQTSQPTPMGLNLQLQQFNFSWSPFS